MFETVLYSCRIKIESYSKKVIWKKINLTETSIKIQYQLQKLFPQTKRKSDVYFFSEGKIFFINIQFLYLVRPLLHTIWEVEWKTLCWSATQTQSALWRDSLKIQDFLGDTIFGIEFCIRTFVYIYHQNLHYFGITFCSNNQRCYAHPGFEWNIVL